MARPRRNIKRGGNWVSLNGNYVTGIEYIFYVNDFYFSSFQCLLHSIYARFILGGRFDVDEGCGGRGMLRLSAVPFGTAPPPGFSFARRFSVLLMIISIKRNNDTHGQYFFYIKKLIFLILNIHSFSRKHLKTQSSWKTGKRKYITVQDRQIRLDR